MNLERNGHGPLVRTIVMKKQFGRSKAMLLLVAAIVVLVATSFFAMVPGQISTGDRPKSVHRVSPRFTILDKPMSDHGKKSNRLKRSFAWYREHWYQRPSGGHLHDQASESAIWEKTDLPHWMKEYFSWHRQKTLEPTKFSQRYLILQCLEQDKQCGGLADRLLALPFLILLASQSRRILLIVWTVPFPLEEFLLPRTNGVDWMLPAPNSSVPAEVTQDAILSAPSLVDKSVFTRINTIVPAARNKSLGVVRVRIQDYVSAWDYYVQHQPNSPNGILVGGSSPVRSKLFP
jgi:hypothetical protein